MPSKQKNQHLIPRCYLANFVSDEVSPEHANNPRFERGVWTTDPSLEHEWTLQGTGKLLSRSYAYELPGDLPHEQKLENYLGTVETPWPSIIQALGLRQNLTAEQESRFRLFLGTLFQRSDAVMATSQGWSSQIEELYRRVERDTTGQEAAADELFRDTQHLSKVLIMNPAFDAVLGGLRLHFVCNETPNAFLSSDAPVWLTHRHADEVARLLPANSVQASAPTNVRRPLVLCPLTPKLMLVACEFLGETYDDRPFMTITDVMHSSLLNLLTIENARDLLLSSLRAPFGSNQAAVAKILRSGSCGPQQQGAWLRLYTSEHRYWLPLDEFERTIQTIRFRTPSLDLLREASEDESLVSAEVFVDGRPHCGMREIQFDHVDLTGAHSSVIGAKLKLPIGT